MEKRKKQKILQISYCSLAKAGIQTVIMDIVRNLSDDFDFDILLFTNKREYYDEEFEKYGRIFRISCYDYRSKLHKYYCYITRPFKQLFSTYRLLKKEKYDIVHYHYGLDGFPILIAAKLAGVNTIISHAHNTVSPEKRSFVSKIYRFLAKKVIHFTSNKRVGCSEEANKFLFNDDSAVVINNPIDITKFSNEKNPHIASDYIRVTNVGRYCFQKNQEFVIDIFNNILKNAPDSQLNLVGFGENLSLLKNRVKELGIEDNVNFIDGQADIPTILANTDIFLFPSRYEGLGIVLIEAQAMGVYCFASDVIPKISNAGFCTYLPLNLSAEQWANEILIVAKDLKKGLKDKTCIDVSGFSIDNIKKIYYELYLGNSDINSET